jgi:hypothetical protein
MASAIFDIRAFIKRLTAAGMPEEQAEILAEEHARMLGEQLATKHDIALLRADMVSGSAERSASTRSAWSASLARFQPPIWSGWACRAGASVASA